jgi:hypothetical protein
LAEAPQAVRLHPHARERLERGHINPTLLSMYTLAETLGTSVTAFLTDEG